ncbi:DUF6801 domain-containing protein, partial [Actinomadura fulvescens]
MALAAAFVAGSSLVGVPHAAAATATGKLSYRCDYPLLGLNDIEVDMSIDALPDTVKVNEEVGPFKIKATTKIGPETVEGLRAVNAVSLGTGGYASADVSLRAPNYPEAIVQDIPIENNKAVPESGEMTVLAEGETPVTYEFDTAGWAQIAVGNLTLNLTPLNAAGQPTSLGPLKVTCYQKPIDQQPDKKNWLHQFYIDGGGTQPPKPAPQNIPVNQPPVVYPKPTYDPNWREYNLSYTCVLPKVGSSSEKGILKVNAKVNFPQSVKVNEHAPRIEIKSVNTLGAPAVGALKQVQATDIKGITAYAHAEMRVPQFENPVLAIVKMVPPQQPIRVPQNVPPVPMVINADGSAPSLVFTKAGAAEMKIGNIDLKGLTPIKADGTPTELGTFDAPCTPEEGVPHNAFIKFDILPNGGTELPG